MTRQRHYHPLAALRFLRKAVVVCLLPLANALLEFSLNALLTALRQDAALLLFLCGASSILLEASSWALDEAGVLRLRWAFISKRERIIRGEALAALTIERPLFFRLLGASRVVLYPVGQPAKRAVTLYLHKEDAQELADRLMPVRDPVCHRPAGGERAALVVLGANGLSTLALTYLAVRQSRPFPLTAEEEAEFLKLMAPAGRLDAVPENLIDAASCVSGCGPAWVYQFIEALADGGVACGLPRAKAQEYAAQMVLGSAKLVLESGQHPGALKDAVCSPGGSTIQGVRVLEEKGLRGAVMDAVIASYNKTKEMGKG